MAEGVLRGTAHAARTSAEQAHGGRGAGCGAYLEPEPRRAHAARRPALPRLPAEPTPEPRAVGGAPVSPSALLD